MIDHLDLRKDLTTLLTLARDAATDEDAVALLDAVAARDTIALAEVCCGPRAPGGPSLCRAALRHAPALEKQLSARGFYPRLAEMSAVTAHDVLQLASSRHPAAGWLIALSRRIEVDLAGETHLVAAAAHPAFATACRAHADGGHREGLIVAAGRTGRAEPAAALLAATWVDPLPALRAASAALETNAASPVVAHLAAVFGPEPDGLVRRIVPLLRTRAAAEALYTHTRHLPHTRALLLAVIPGMAG